MSSEDVKKKIIDLLKTVYDPEIPINIYDLGLVYNIEVEGNTINVTLGLTTPFCPMAFMVVQQAEHILKQSFPDKEIKVNLDLERIWNPQMMTEEGRRLFKILYGYDPAEKTA
ncbi:protein of unknown function DUF59 [Ignisphaera aggregans DSM 17230]|uniref:MIP18 family-like domain-containing protein n=1 Tax=Ignisphaera aggregans (strain DSM 17230 / JCM 13409 / AQ1.S1) TaxID=583356 RepID=E0ST54_IGNAA|nr:protein of unknown function DUF59 [Ignisphaera aggregans DSM 17230]